MKYALCRCGACRPTSHSGVMGTDEICDKVCFTQMRCLSSRPPPPHVHEYRLSAPSVYSAPRSQSSAGLAALCLCVQIDQAQIPGYQILRIISGIGFPGQFNIIPLFNMIPRNPIIPSPPVKPYPSPLPRRRFSRTCPLNRRPVSEDRS